jgi:polyphenol oxidase
MKTVLEVPLRPPVERVRALFTLRAWGDGRSLLGDNSPQDRFPPDGPRPPAPIFLPQQRHTARVVLLRRPGQPSEIADGVVTAQPGLPMGVLTADCLPIVLAHPEGPVVGVAHAGWRGSLDGVAKETLRTMLEVAGGPVEAVRVTFAPCISGSVYEVGAEIRAVAVHKLGPLATEAFTEGLRPGKFLLDLVALNARLLAAAGVLRDHMTFMAGCTLGEPDRFHSYRGQGEAAGRHATVAWIVQ